jgi:hypothetical protein
MHQIESELIPELVENLVRMNESRAIAFIHSEKLKDPVWMTLGEWDLALKQLLELEERPLKDEDEWLATVNDWKSILMRQERYLQVDLDG